MKQRQETTRLSPLDRGFLWLERFGQPLHVGYLMLLTPPKDAAPEFAMRLVDRLRAWATPAWPFDRRLENGSGGSWIADTRFDINRHVVRLAVSRAGDLTQLMHLVSDLHATRLDRRRPLWRVHVIEGLNDGRIAIYCKMHHALADGVGGTRLLLRSMSSDGDERLPPPWAVSALTTRQVDHDSPDRDDDDRVFTMPPSRISRFLGGLGAVLNALPMVASEVLQMRREVREGHPGTVSGAQAPACILNRRISDSREFAARSYSRSRIKALCGAFDCATNDLVLALCATALRQYLLDLDALPDRPLIALVPMSTRRDESTNGNQIVPLLVNLGTQLADPFERLRTICRSTDRSIDRHVGMNGAEAYGYTLATSARGLVNLLLRPASGNLAFNLVISKLSGPRSQLYWEGCRLDGMYPASVVMDGLGLNITVTIRNEWLDFGLVACPQTIPRAQRLLVYLETALDEFESLALGRVMWKRAANESLAASTSAQAANEDRSAA